MVAGFLGRLFPPGADSEDEGDRAKVTVDGESLSLAVFGTRSSADTFPLEQVEVAPVTDGGVRLVLPDDRGQVVFRADHPSSFRQALGIGDTELDEADQAGNSAGVGYEAPASRLGNRSERAEVGRGQGGILSTVYAVEIPGITGHEIAVRHGIFGGLKVLVDGERAKRGSKRSKSLLPADDGSEIEATVQLNRAGADPKIVISGNSVSLGRRLEPHEWIWVGIPLVLVVWSIFGGGGALGILAGGLAFAANVRIFTNDGMSPSTRYLNSLIVMVVFAVVYLAIGVAVFALVT